MKPRDRLLFAILGVAVGILFSSTKCLLANIPGGGTNGPDVNLVDNGATVTIGNGIVSILCTKSGATINQVNYTCNNSGATVTNQLLAGGSSGGQLYWTRLGSFVNGTFTYSLVANPANNGGNYAEISLSSTSATNGTMEVHFSMLRGSTGFYVAVIWSHRSADGAIALGEERENIYAGSIFNWMSVDALRNRLMEVQPGAAAVGVFNAPVEVSLWTNGIYAGQYEDKYKYSADYGVTRVWGWSSVGSGGNNIGLWNVTASPEYYATGPMKRENKCHIGTTILNVLNSGHYGLGTDDGFADGEIWTKVYGPYFIYCNNITNAITATNQAAQALYDDAQAQATAEQTAWPYSWFTNANYAPASGRGTVTGQMVINDSFNPNASTSNLWVGLIQQPSTAGGNYDFQQWAKPYQFWVKTGANGNFIIPGVIAGGNYTLYAFGPGAAGTFQSQAQSGGSAPNTLDIPVSPFSVTVMAGATNNLGGVIWTPARVGATVFEIGYPDRNATEFRHGEDWWVGDIGPSPTNPLPVWSKWLEYPFDFPSGPNYAVGQSRWSTDWNFIQPTVFDAAGNMNGSTSTITFNLPAAPTNGAAASLYLALASDYQGPLIIQVNGSDIAGSAGYSPPYSGSSAGSDASVREGIHGIFSDMRANFAANLLQSGQNTITLNMRKGGGDAGKNHAMYDYLRLELTGYVPPPPGSAAVYPGNNCNLICWPVTPGATSYNLLRSTISGGGYVSITNGVTGPVCGSGWNNAAYLDTTAVNGATYYYVVQSVNPAGASTNSPESFGVTPGGSFSASAPAAPIGLNVSSIGHQTVTVNWNASPGANFYTVYRSTLFNNGGGASNVLRTIVLANNVTGTSYTDTSPTDGGIYSYFVTATSAGGTSGNSTAVVGVVLPALPANAPGSLTGTFLQGTSIILNWSSVPGAVGYIIRRATNANGPYIFLQSITETTCFDSGLNTNTTYYYQVAAVNAAGTSANASVSVPPPPPGPSLTAVPGNGQVLLTWNVSSGATNYLLQSSTTDGGPYNTVASTAAISYLNTGLTNGTTYYYVVYAEDADGQGPSSVQASATPFAGPLGVYWANMIASSPQSWNVSSNWSGGAAFPNGTQAVAIVNSAIAVNQAINLNQNITLGAMSVGASGGAAAFNIATNGGTLTLDNTPGLATLLQLPSSAGDTISAPIAVNGNLFVTNASANALTLSGNISGAASGLTVCGNVVTLSGSNAYSGGTMVNSGRLVFGTAAAIPAAGVLTLNNTAALTVMPASSLPNVTVTGSNAITGNGTSGTGISTLDLEGTLTLAISGGSSVFDLTGTMTGAGTLVLGSSAMTLRFNGTAGDGAANFNLGTGSAIANVRKTITAAIALGGLAGGAGTQLQGDNSSGGANVTYTIGGAGANTEFDGLVKDGSVGSVALVKTGSGALTLAGANAYSAGTTISNGTLLVNNPSGSGAGSGVVTVANGGALGGTGIISGAVTVNSGGTFFPGNPLGALTIGNSLKLAAGSTNIFAISQLPLTNAAAKISGALTNGGTLIVTNIGGTQLVPGDTFKLFQAAASSGTFSSVELPALPFGLAWNTNSLNTGGTISVIRTTTPVIRSASISGSGLTLSGTGGVGSANFVLLGTTNISTSHSNWTRLLTNQFDGNGSFNFTNSAGTNAQNFYLLQIP
jgi:rhamnogalacturonan endolyase